ncbi:hypothetical protein GQ53DRAFT_838351 [Thozetella sp. PMI_491]|nr:hypothetical protein GQ53DRAFT_838351 [Thozetella sp. PMI_491]
MDPFTALGFASNIVSFLDFTCGLVSGTWAIYRSATGSSERTHELRTIAADLQSLTEDLTISIDRGTTRVGAGLRTIAFDCQSVSKDLQRVLSTLETSGKATVWKSFLVALAEVWRTDQVANLGTRLDALQRELNTHLLKLLLDQQSDIRGVLDRIDDQNKRFEMDRAAGLQSLKQELLGALHQLSGEQTLSRLNVRQYFQSLSGIEEVRTLGETRPGPQELRFKTPVSQLDTQVLSERMKGLSMAMESVSRESKIIATEQMVLQSLSFPGMMTRHDNVKEAHSSTFGWIFREDGSSDESDRAPCFADWLRQQDGIYWISGKPGSGKSTLIKFLCDNDKTNELLKEWAGEHRLVVARYFFWSRGSKLQKSQEGLFRNLLFEIFRQDSSLISQVCDKYTQIAPYQADPAPWTLKELIACFDKLGGISASATRFCLFIDGLDEYDAPEEGDFAELSRVLKHVSGHSDIKVCLSSRPENDFRSAFGTGKGPERCLRMEEHTKDDIRRFVQECFAESSRFRLEVSRDPRYEDLVQQIVNDANGVFLWVSLAVKTLLDGFTNADRISDLEDRLKKTPKTLEEYFRHMLDSVDEHYRTLAAMQIQTCLVALEPLSLLTLWYLDDLQSTTPVVQRERKRPQTTSTDPSYIEDTISARLQARGKGLLEMTILARKHRPNMDALEKLLGTKSDFLHRTVRDYLLGSEMQRELRMRLPNGFDARLNLCRAYVAQLGDLLYFGAEKETLGLACFSTLDELLRCSARIEQDSDELLKLLQPLLDEADRKLAHIQPKLPSSRKASFLGLSVEYGLHRYVAYRLDENTELVHDKDNPLLVHGLHPRRVLTPVSVEMIKLLLQRGANPNEKCIAHSDRYTLDEEIPKRISIWHQFLYDLKFDSAPRVKENMDLFDILELLVTHGANIRERVHVQTTFRPKKETGRAADLYKSETAIHHFEQADGIVAPHLSSKQIQRLLESHSTVKGKSSSSRFKALLRRIL